MARTRKDLTDGDREVFTPHYFHRGLGRRVYAWEYGLKVFHFVIRAKPTPNS